MSDKLREALRDMLDGWKYIRRFHGDLYGVGWDRAQTKAEEALAADDAARGTMREEFEAWFERYHTEACEQFGGIDCTNPKGIAEDAWQASRTAAPQSVGKAASGPVVSRDSSGRQWVDEPQRVEPLFLLHCGAIYEGERVQWDVVAYSDKAVDAFADAHPDQIFGLFAVPPTTPTDAEWLEEAMRWAIALEKAGRELTFATASERAEFRAKREAALAALRAHLSTRPAQAEEWIACSERLPNPDSGEVLVWLWESKMYALDEWHTYREDPTGMGGPTLDMGLMWRHFDFDEVSHWRPLPAPPTKTKEQGS